MPNEQDDILNKLLGRRGSIAERTRMAKELDDDRLQMAAPYSSHAKEELERRRHESLLGSVRAPVTPEDEIQGLDDQLNSLGSRFVKSSEGLILVLMTRGISSRSSLRQRPFSTACSVPTTGSPAR